MQDEAVSPAALWAAFRTCEVWAEASDQGVRTLVDRATVYEVPRGVFVFGEGEPANAIGVVITGHLRAVQLGERGRTLSVFTPRQGDVLGIVGIVGGQKYLLSFEALEDSQVAVVPYEALVELLRSEPIVHWSIERILVQQFTLAVRVAKMLFAPVTARIAAYVLGRAKQYPAAPGGLGVVDLGVSRSELAGILGTTPETLSRCFRELERDGFIKDGGRHITVLDERGLIDCCGTLL